MTKKDKTLPDDFFNFKLFGLNIGGLIKNLGITDIENSTDPKKIDWLKKQINEKNNMIKKEHEEFQNKFADKAKVEYGIKVKSILGDDEFTSNGKFFDNLNQRFAKHKEKIYPKNNKVLEPFTEVLEQKEHIQVLAEMPGVTLNDISLRRIKNILTIKTKKDSSREYLAQVELPSQNLKLVEKKFNNGILRLQYTKKTNH